MLQLDYTPITGEERHHRLGRYKSSARETAFREHTRTPGLCKPTTTSSDSDHIAASCHVHQTLSLVPLWLNLLCSYAQAS